MSLLAHRRGRWRARRPAREKRARVGLFMEIVSVLAASERGRRDGPSRRHARERMLRDGGVRGGAALGARRGAMAPPGTLRLPVVVGGLLPFASGGPQRAGRLARHCAFTRQVDVTLQVVPQQNAGAGRYPERLRQREQSLSHITIRSSGGPPLRRPAGRLRAPARERVDRSRPRRACRGSQASSGVRRRHRGRWIRCAPAKDARARRRRPDRQDRLNRPNRLNHYDQYDHARLKL